MSPKRQGLGMIVGAVAVAVAAGVVIFRLPKDEAGDGIGLSWQHDDGRVALKDGGKVVAGRGKLVLALDKTKLPAGAQAAAVLVGPDDAPQPASVTSVDLAAAPMELPIFPAAGRYKVCVADAESAAALKTKTDVMSGTWDAVSGANCVRLTAK